MDSNKLTLAVVLTIALSLVTLFVFAMYNGTRHTEEMAKLGYQETTVTGLSGTVWTKVQQDTVRY